MNPVTAYVGLGANLGDARGTLLLVAVALQRTPGVVSLRLSSLWRSAPVDAAGPDFVNAVAELRTTLTPLALLHALQAMEQAHGRKRPYRNAPRTLDLDLLLHGSAVLDTPELTLPHPRLQQRAFVLQPLLELAPDLVLPAGERLADSLPAVSGQTLERLL